MKFLIRLMAVSGFLAAVGGVAAIAAADPLPAPERVAEYAAEGAESVVDLQQYRTSQTSQTSQTIRIEGSDGRTGAATLVSINPSVAGILPPGPTVFTRVSYCRAQSPPRSSKTVVAMPTGLTPRNPRR